MSLTKAKLKPGEYSLSRVKDGAGASGHLFNSIKVVDLDNALGWYYKKVGEDGEVIVGNAVRCGHVTPKTLAVSCWVTTEVTEILSINEDNTEVTFKTKNSEYIARSC